MAPSHDAYAILVSAELDPFVDPSFVSGWIGESVASKDDDRSDWNGCVRMTFTRR